MLFFISPIPPNDNSNALNGITADFTPVSGRPEEVTDVVPAPVEVDAALVCVVAAADDDTVVSDADEEADVVSAVEVAVSSGWYNDSISV